MWPDRSSIVTGVGLEVSKAHTGLRASFSAYCLQLKMESSQPLSQESRLSASHHDDHGQTPSRAVSRPQLNAPFSKGCLGVTISLSLSTLHVTYLQVLVVPVTQSSRTHTVSLIPSWEPECVPTAPTRSEGSF